MVIVAYIVMCLIGYIMGCSNMAYYLAQQKGVNMFAKGSGNPGASNAVLLMGWRAGALVAVHDIGKAVLAVGLARLLFPGVAGISEVAGAACVLGHIFPVFQKFRGGKGFASYIGMMLMLNWKIGLLILAAVVLITVISDYLVLGTTFTVVSLPVFLFVTAAGWIALVAVCLATCVIIYKHKENYIRIVKGTEIGLRSAMKGEHRVK